MRTAKIFLVLLILGIGAHHANGATGANQKQVGLGFGVASPTSGSAYALTAILEGTMRFSPFFGASILATATSSPKIAGTYYFGSNGGYQQTFIEPRLYLKFIHLGFAVGLDLASDGSGTIQGLVSYGPMAGFEVPINQFSIGVDARYIMKSGTNPSPLSLLMMFRFNL